MLGKGGSHAPPRRYAPRTTIPTSCRRPPKATSQRPCTHATKYTDHTVSGPLLDAGRHAGSRSFLDTTAATQAAVSKTWPAVAQAAASPWSAATAMPSARSLTSAASQAAAPCATKAATQAAS